MSLPEYLPEHDLRRKILIAQGVPVEAIHLVEPAVVATRDEVQVVIKNMRERGFHKTILVTSIYHSRRVQVTWNEINDGDCEAIVRYTRRTPFVASHWWRNSWDVLAVTREVGRILNAWAGFPQSSERH